jgi:hypothetical protein
MRDSGKVNKYCQFPRRSHQVPESSNHSQYHPQRVFSVRIGVSRIFPRIWHSRVFSSNQLPRQWCFRGKNFLFPFLDKFCPERQCDFWGVDLREKMWDSGKVNKNYQHPSLRIFTSNQLPGILSSLTILPSNWVPRDLEQLSGVDYGKRCETRELTIFIIFSRISHLFP